MMFDGKMIKLRARPMILNVRKGSFVVAYKDIELNHRIHIKFRQKQLKASMNKGPAHRTKYLKPYYHHKLHLLLFWRPHVLQISEKSSPEPEEMKCCEAKDFWVALVKALSRSYYVIFLIQEYQLSVFENSYSCEKYD